MAFPKKPFEYFHPHPAFGHLLPEGEGINRNALGQIARGCRSSVLECGAPNRFGSRPKAAGTAALHDAVAHNKAPSPSGRERGEGECGR